MWDILSGDFDRDLDPEQCYHNVIDNARPGSIIVFHDSIKAEGNLRWALPKVLEFFSRKGYRFSSLQADMAQAEHKLRKIA
jgi:peptidoglycan/xylan/chitin deacetylase (PgdA/CDA1 family)